MPGDLGDHLRRVRRGEVAFEEVVAESEALEAEVRVLLDGRLPLPAQPDRAAAEQWLIAAHRAAWGW